MPISLVAAKRYEGQRVTLKPAGIQIATKSLPQVKAPENTGNSSASIQTMSLCTNYSFYCLECWPLFQNLNYKLQRRLSDVLPIYQTEVTRNYISKPFGGFHEDKILQALAPTNAMSTRFTKPPLSISNATQIDSDCCKTQIDSLRLLLYSMVITYIARVRINRVRLPILLVVS